MLIVVSDTTAITNLAAIQQLHLLHELYGNVVIPDAVRRELTEPELKNPGASEIQTVPWISSRSVMDHDMVSQLLTAYEALDQAEAEAIVLAIEIRADLLIIDEGVGRDVAEALDLPFTGVLGGLLDAKERLLIPAVKPILDKLIANGFWLDSSLYASVLRLAGE